MDQAEPRVVPGTGPARPAPHRPDGHVPRGGPAREVRWPDGVSDVVVAFIGVQGADRGQVAEAAALVRARLTGPHGPTTVERSRTAAPDAPVEEVVACYWTDPAAHAAWWASVADWWAGLPVDGPVGHWHETVTTPVTRMETMYSSTQAAGPSTLAPVGDTDLHDYPHAARDRIEDVDLAGATAPLRTDLPVGGSPRGRRVRLAAPSPAGLCLIRTAQDWALAPQDQLTAYREQVEPTYRAAVRHLSTAPAEDGCLAIRLVEDLGEDGGEAPSSAVCAWWRGLADLERWAHHHPTHHAILGAFWTALVEPNGPELRLRLWHEVRVLDAGGLTAEWVNCAPGTGLLPAGDALAG
ncbi:phenylacetaldoxime dehydratase family protein [Actinosynnema sp. NPDC050436]|uniref:phenylacetaldoxime dehydratase family protein n=1 Tax=Actinosynnema sp. NPDC050436 TaxID=3155659 RepID=UPI0033F34CBD